MLVRPDDAEHLAVELHALLEYPERRRQLGEAGRRAVSEQRSATAMAAQTISLYSKLLGENS